MTGASFCYVFNNLIYKINLSCTFIIRAYECALHILFSVFYTIIFYF